MLTGIIAMMLNNNHQTKSLKISMVVLKVKFLCVKMTDGIIIQKQKLLIESNISNQEK